MQKILEKFLSYFKRSNTDLYRSTIKNIITHIQSSEEIKSLRASIFQSQEQNILKKIETVILDSGFN